MAEEVTEPEVEETEEVEPEVEETEVDWKAMARKHERNAKKLLKEKADLEKSQKDREDADKTETQKAIDKAREEGKTEALTAAEKERRSDRLEVQVTRIASKGVSVGDKTVRFADTDDALLRIERAIKSGDIDSDDIFDSEGKVHTDALTAALKDILEAAPHLAAGDARPSKGASDAGKGAGSSELSDDPEDHFRRKRENK